MENRTEKISSDAEWYCRKNPEEDRFYEIFFQMCQKYGVRWASAEEKERRFIEEVARVTCERERALRLGYPLSGVRPSFASRNWLDPQSDPHGERSGWNQWSG